MVSMTVMWARGVLLALLVSGGTAAAESPPVVPYPGGDYKTSLVRYAVVDRIDGLSRDLYVSRAGIEALKRDPRLREFPVGVLFAFTARSGSPGTTGRAPPPSSPPPTVISRGARTSARCT
jgi:hypothetical protein